MRDLVRKRAALASNGGDSGLKGRIRFRPSNSDYADTESARKGTTATNRPTITGPQTNLQRGLGSVQRAGGPVI